MRSSTASVLATALSLTIAQAVSAAPVVPDATFTGTVNGVITSGSTTESIGINEFFRTATYPLAGTRISIGFTADVTYDYVDQDEIPYSRYVVSSVTVSITPAAPLGIYQSTQSNDFMNLFGFADYTGNATSGVFDIGGIVMGEPDFGQYVNFAFSGARSTQSALTGSGSGSTHFFVPFGTEETVDHSIDSQFTFTLTDGFVTGPGQTLATPEPATWSLMIAGMGAIGGAMRRTRRQRMVA